ncbi:hypothetical protein BCR41DRAFT_391280 [Lobosporangium transversale]|uniref:F-box domain-containing protein n=1 Tax=Lobosporangium transversale TaxID=64571 RepID=A0A1Y2H2Q7_9FUNG|nr:hypothetical protein BCR41DRAFT_391280 [Lobosporangium transversale]ORZ28859.1 hypothetical protein BCR41DRAFT_391280 [Lobosporangium transversale]|eukprot:XP_021886532.1 hypothetical protein BCR41DRAFT_391280 [Lobosporangium transversale]
MWAPDITSRTIRNIELFFGEVSGVLNKDTTKEAGDLVRLGVYGKNSIDQVDDIYDMSIITTLVHITGRKATMYIQFPLGTMYIMVQVGTWRVPDSLETLDALAQDIGCVVKTATLFHSQLDLLPAKNIALQKHKEHIEDLRFESGFPEEYGSLQGCNHLDLIDYQGKSLPEPIHFLNLIKAHSSIITTFPLSSTLASYELWKALLGYEDMAALLRQMTELRRLYTPVCDFSQLSLQELLADKQEVADNGHMIRKTRLRRLCETIKVLEFSTFGSVDGIVQAILSNCPKLERLTGPTITVTEIVNGAEWASTRLTDLNVYFKADVDQETVEGMAKMLDLKLRADFDELTNLKSLCMLWFSDDEYQQTGLEDATWTVNNWPSSEA